MAGRPEYQELLQDNDRLRRQLQEAQEVLEAIRTGTVDAVVASGPKGNQVFTLEGADRPYRVFIEEMQQGAVTLSANRMILYHNRRFSEMLAQSQSQLLGTCFDQLLVAASRETFTAILQQATTGRATGELELLIAEGKTLPVFVAVNLSRAEGIAEFCVVIADLSEQKQHEKLVAAEELVRRHREWLQVTLQSIGDAVIATDRDARITFMNAVAEQLTGYSAEQAIGRPLETVFSIINELTRAPGENPIGRVLRDGHVVGLANHTALIHRDGRQIPIEDSAAPIRDAAGKAVGVVMVFHDVTGKRQAEEALRQAKDEAERRAREAEERERVFSAMMEHIPLGITIADAPDVRIRAVSRYGRELTGQPRDSIEGISAELHAARWHILRKDGVTPASNEELPLTRATKKGELVREEEFVIQRPDGSKVPLICSAAPIQDAQGKIIGGVSGWQDITERKQAEARLSQSEERFRRVVDSNVVGIMFAEAEGRVLHANDYFLKLLGFTRPELTCGRINWRAQTPPEYQPLDEKALRELHETGICMPYEKELVRKDGQRVWVHLSDTMLPGPDRPILAFVLDVTERKKAHQALQEAHRRKDEFLAMLGHELRNPLAPIRNAVHVLKRTGPAEPQLVRAYGMIDRQVGHMARLVDDLLDVSRISRGKIQLKKETLDLTGIVGLFANDHLSGIESSGLKFQICLPPQPLWVLGDPARIQQIVGNLLNNAIKFTDAGGCVKLSLDVVGQQAQILVEDTGIGIDAGVQSEIFEPFNQGAHTYERNRGGLGLGLALVRGLAELHGGSVEVISAGIGQGARFVVRLPLAQAQAQPSAAAGAAVPHAAGTHRVLIIEDNLDAAESLSMLLSVLGHQTAQAHSGAEGLRKAREFRPDVVLCDIGLPEMDGYEVARMFRSDKELQAASLIALTGYGQEEDRRKALQAGFDYHLTKPADPEALARLLAS